MALSEEIMDQFTFKKALNKEFSGVLKPWSGELDGEGFLIPSSRVWADSADIPSTPPGSSTSLIEVYDPIELTMDGSVGGNRCWRVKDTGVQQRNIIPPIFGLGYSVELYTEEAKTNVLTPDDPSHEWMFDYENGILVFNENQTYTELWMVCRRYKGALGVGAAAYISAGFLGEPEYTIEGTGQVTIQAGQQCCLWDNPTHTGSVQVHTLAGITTGGDSVPLIPELETVYIVGQYNAGNPRLWVLMGAQLAQINESDVIPYLTCYRHGTTTFVMKWTGMAAGLPNRTHQRFVKTWRIAREKGLDLGEGATRRVTIAVGKTWNGVNYVNEDAFDSGDLTGDGLYVTWFNTPTGWKLRSWTQYTNTQWNDITQEALQDLTTGYYVVHWIYRGQQTEDVAHCVIGQGQYSTLQEAMGEAEPANLPYLFNTHTIMVGRIIAREGQDTAGLIEGAFPDALDLRHIKLERHDAFLGIQGGITGEHYHITAQQNSDLNGPVNAAQIQGIEVDVGAVADDYVLTYNSVTGKIEFQQFAGGQPSGHGSLTGLKQAASDHNIISYNHNGTPTYGIRINTNIDFTTGSSMPTIIIEGRVHEAYKTIGLIITWYVYGTPEAVFNGYSVSSFGGYAPPVKLARIGGKVVVFLDMREYYVRFGIRAFAQGMSQDIDSKYVGWSISDADLSTADKIVTVPYNTDLISDSIIALDRYGARVGAPSSVIWGISRDQYPNYGFFYEQGTPDLYKMKWGGEDKWVINAQTGALGIGMSPSYLVDIRQTCTGYSPSAPTPGIRLVDVGTAGGYTSIMMYGRSGVDAGNVALTAVGSGSGSADLAIGTRHSYSFSEKMRLTSDGKFGIGGVPSAPLQVNVPDGSNQIIAKFGVSDDKRLTIMREDTADRMDIYYYNSPTYRPINIGSSSEDVLVVDGANIRVGIGGTPTTHLHVIQDNAELKLESSVVGPITGRFLAYGSSDPSLWIQSSAKIKLGNIGGSTVYMTINTDGKVNIGDALLEPHTDGRLTLHTDFGWLKMGPGGATLCHFYTDMPAFFFGEPVIVQGSLKPSVDATHDFGDATFRWENGWFHRSVYVGAGFSYDTGVNVHAGGSTAWMLMCLENNNGIQLKLTGAGVLTVAGSISEGGIGLSTKYFQVANHTKATHDSLALEHGSFTGLGDDDHTQYYNATRHTKTVHDALLLSATEIKGVEVDDSGIGAGKALAYDDVSGKLVYTGIAGGIDWTDAVSNFKTTGTGEFGGNVLVGPKLGVGGAVAATAPLRLTSVGKFAEIGCLNTSYCHMQTDASAGFYFYKTVNIAAGQKLQFAGGGAIQAL